MSADGFQEYIYQVVSMPITWEWTPQGDTGAFVAVAEHGDVVFACTDKETAEYYARRWTAAYHAVPVTDQEKVDGGLGELYEVGELKQPPPEDPQHAVVLARQRAEALIMADCIYLGCLGGWLWGDSDTGRYTFWTEPLVLYTPPRAASVARLLDPVPDTPPPYETLYF